mgnify:CR=1 FL=1
MENALIIIGVLAAINLFFSAARFGEAIGTRPLDSSENNPLVWILLFIVVIVFCLLS